MLDLLYKGNPLITAVVDDCIFSKIFKTILERKMKMLLLLGYCNDEIRINIFYTSEKLSEFLKMIFINILQNVAIDLFKCFVSHITLIPPNNTFIYYSTNQISLCYIILQNAFLVPD